MKTEALDEISGLKCLIFFFYLVRTLKINEDIFI